MVMNIDSVIIHLKQAINWSDPFLIPMLYMIIRGTIIYILGVIVTRFNKRIIGIHTPFNLILFIMLGSIFASAIIKTTMFLSIVGVFLFLTVLNATITALAFHFPLIEQFIKGSPAILVKNSQIQWPAMRENFITKRELINELQTQLHTSDLKTIVRATLESDGSINFVEK